MGEAPKFLSPQPEGPAAASPGGVVTIARRGLRRQFAGLLAASVAAFVMTTWWLVRQQNSPGLFTGGSEPASLVRQQLAALNHGELRAAYAMFSERYRKEVPFEAFHDLVVTHRAMFRTRAVRFHSDEQAAGRVVLDTELVSADGGRYVARFTLLRDGGRWWVDDLRWAAQSRRRNFLKV